MRQGNNPIKGSAPAPETARHRVIIPVYIPSTDGYFARLPEILELCLESLHLSVAGRAAVTVISNGCMSPVVERLQAMCRAGWIDQLVLNRENVGKLNAIIPAARASFEELITFADADVFFDAGWLEAVETVFAAFPECGSVSPVPRQEHVWKHTSATIVGALTKGVLRFAPQLNEEDIALLLRVFGAWHHDFWETQMVVTRKNSRAIVGAGHFTVTLRRDMLRLMPQAPHGSIFAAGAEEAWIDAPPDRHGYWKLATPHVYAHHMGNVPEPWITERLAALRQLAGTSRPPRPGVLPRPRPSMIPAWIRDALVALLCWKQLYRLLFRPLGFRPTNDREFAKYRARSP